jgi:hypothetical protein
VVAGGEDAVDERLQAARASAERLRVQPLHFLHGMNTAWIVHDLDGGKAHQPTV